MGRNFEDDEHASRRECDYEGDSAAWQGVQRASSRRGGLRLGSWVRRDNLSWRSALKCGDLLV
jgi:hypothetical protein